MDKITQGNSEMPVMLANRRNSNMCYYNRNDGLVSFSDYTGAYLPIVITMDTYIRIY